MSIPNANNNYDLNAPKYANLSLEGQGSVYLAFRDLAQLFLNHAPTLYHAREAAKVLDYGCGAGRSTRYFKKIIGIHDVLGADVNREMLKVAKENDQDGRYILIDTAKVPAEDNEFDVVILSFVLVEISTAEEIKNIFTELKRVLKKGGVLFIVTVSAELFQEEYDWVSYDQKNRGNQNLQNGECGRFKIDEIDMEFEDFHWEHETIVQLAQKAGFELCEYHRPLGNPDEENSPIVDAWKSEKTISPYANYLFMC